MAAAMAGAVLAEAGLTAEIFSAGTNAYEGQPASRHAISVMEEGGLCLLSHRSALVSDEMLKDANLVLTMTVSHRDVLYSDYPRMRDVIFTLGEYAGNKLDVSDPFGGSQDEYRACAAQIKAMLLRAVEKLK